MSAGVEFPPEQQRALRRARRLAWATLAYLATAVAFVAVTMGQSQAMKTVWFEDLLSLAPAISFLIGARIAHRGPNEKFPYGYHRVVSIAHLAGALALFAFGAWLFAEGVLTLARQEHPTIGTTRLLGHDVWSGWLMIAASLYSAIPAVVLGARKLPLAEKIHDKGLYADAHMNLADWKTGVAAAIGIVGIGFGWWWADAVAAALISLDIVLDGVRNLKAAVTDLMDRAPETIARGEVDPLIEAAESGLLDEGWVLAGRVRLREEGHVLVGEAFVVPGTTDHLVERCEALRERIEGIHWRLHEVVVVPVSHLP